MKKIREAITNIRTDIKDHMVGTVLYTFMIILPAAVIETIFGLYAVGVGLLLAILWEFGNKYIEKNEFSIFDIVIYLITVSPITIILFKYL